MPPISLMPLSGDSLGFIVGPWQIMVVAVLVVGLFAPQLLPKAGRMLGRMLRREALRRVGLSDAVTSRPRPSRPAAVEPAAASPVEIQMPERAGPTLRAQAERPLAPEPTRTRPTPVWLIATIVMAAAAAIFWLLLHTR